MTMELKVWCEGIQRVICGVTETTTCQDVVIALAQAMGKTGRYTLVEKWRESERLIAPDENPVVSLSKWGEYANDVQFILRNSGSRVKSRTNGDISESDSKRTSKLSSHNFSPHLSESRSSSASSLRKSLTFSGAHSRSSLVPNKEIRTRKRDKDGSLNDHSSLESLTERSSQVSQSSRSTFMHSSPYSSGENGRRMRLPDSISSQSSASSLVKKSSAFSNHQGSSSHSNVPFSYTGVSTIGSLERTRRRDPSRYNHTHQLSDTSTHSTGSPPPPLVPSSSNRLYPHRDIKPDSPRRGRTSPLSRDLKPIPRESNNNIDFKLNANLTTTDHKSNHHSNSHSQSNDNSISLQQDERKKVELMKLVNIQLEKIDQQEGNINKLETEISLCQHFDHDVVDDDRVSREIERLQRFDRELDDEIQDLELVSWDGKLELEVEKAARMRSDIKMATQKLSCFQDEHRKIDDKLKDLNEQMTKQRDHLSVKDRQEKECKLKVITEISDLQKQINGHLVKHDEQQRSVDHLQGDVKKFESEILDRKTQIAELEKDLKETNMESFSRTPSDWKKTSQDGQSLFNRVSPSRPGSARRLDSPQRLKEAPATSKNPHGLWV